MKFLQLPVNLEALNKALEIDSIDGCIVGRVESYSCKMLAEEKALYKRFTSDIVPGVNDLATLSPSPSFHESSGEYDCNRFVGEKISTKTFFYLVSTLNASFQPDYDFSNSKPDEFAKEPSIEFVNRNVERHMSCTAWREYAPVLNDLWKALDESICLKDCQIYSYNPDALSDPYDDDSATWSLYYFFYNTKLKRIMLFCCRALCKLHAELNDDDYDIDFEDL